MTQDQEKRPRGRPRTRNRLKTIQQAMLSYWGEGPFSVSVNEICRRAEISKPSFYREFGGEDGLMEAVLEHYWEVALLPFIERTKGEQAFGELLEELIAWLTSERGVPPGCLLGKLRSSPNLLGEATAERVASVSGQMRGTFERWYERALARGEVNPAWAPALAAQYIDTQFSTILVNMGIGMDPELVRAQARMAFVCLAPPGGFRSG